MSFQLKHKDFGVFQGECLGMGFWYPMSNFPEGGIIEYTNKEDADKDIQFMCSDKCAYPLKSNDFKIEVFDFELSAKLDRKARKLMKEIKIEGS